MKQQNPNSLLVTSGNGPAECRQVVAAVLHQMQREANDLDLTLDVSETAGKHGPKSAVVLAYGLASAEFAGGWCGTIKWHAKSQLRPHHKRANWFVGVFALPVSAQMAVQIMEHDVSYESFRAGGPGGQHQNTTDSAVRAIHRPSGLIAVAREMRSQHRNKALALARLQALADARAVADLQDMQSDQNQLHNALERGDPVRCFKGNLPDGKRGKSC